MTTGMIRWTPGDLLRGRFHRFFDEALSDFPGIANWSEEVSRRNWVPPVDIRETDDALVLTAELPGLTKEDIEITLENNVLTIRGERKFERDADKENFHRIERAYGAFSRTFSLPSNVRGDGVEASFRDGVLHIQVPKAEEAKPRKIAIH